MKKQMRMGGVTSGELCVFALYADFSGLVLFAALRLLRSVEARRFASGASG